MIDASKKAKIKWQCRRGMLELDLLLNRFVEERLSHLTEQEFTAFESLLTVPDPLLYAWLMGSENPSNKEQLAIVELIKSQYQPA